MNRRVAGVGFLMEAFECAEGASSVGRAAGEGWVVTIVACTHYKKRHIRDILGRTKKISVILMTLL